MSKSPLEFLLSTRTSQGGWGYFPEHAPAVEPTSAVLLAAGDLSQEAAFQKAVSWLLSIQHPDGGWGINAQDSTSCWQTAWAVWALQHSGVAGKPVRKGIDWLLAEDVMRITDLDDLEAGQRVASIDFSLRGWPWQPGEASWVEPTALSMLALSNAGIQHERLAEAVRYLENRRCPTGGWNVGNPVMFNSTLPVRVHPTAWSLLALIQTSPQSILASDIAALEVEMMDDRGMMGLAWGCLTLTNLSKEIPEKRILLLEESQHSNGGWEENNYITAVAWMALDALGRI